MLIDTHAHLYLDRFSSDRDQAVERARKAGVTRILLPAIDVSSVEDALALCSRHTGCFAMSAIHPSDTKNATDEDLSKIEAYCDDERVIAVGESGLDYYWDRSFDERQMELFRWHIRLAIKKDLPLIIHIRDKRGKEEAHRDVVRILKEEMGISDRPRRLRGIFHCFTGPAWVAREAKDLNFLLGIGGVLTFKNSGLDEIVRDISLQQLVLETDAPFLAPVPHRGKRNEPSYVSIVAEKLADLKEVTLEEVAQITTSNAEALFQLAPLK